ncbi:MFS transporter [Streptomyces sp. NPDC053560]|uniref:MFS transporter n=1 Tax=Streptomyces sp. NPDC053560 TaxID=3365711 RepID=UPI0037D024F3
MNVTAPPRATKREWIGLAVLALPSMLVTMDLTLLHLAVPHLGADLDPSSSQLLWITDIYGFLIAGFLVTMGTVGDRVGRRRLLLGGATVFGIASILTAYAQSPEMLIVTRALLGIAGACLAPSTLSLIRNMFPSPQQRTTAVTVWSTSFMLGGALGPVVGGVLLEHFWWGSVFLLAVPIMVLLLVLGPVLLPEYRNPEADKVDLVSAVLSMISVLSLIYGLKEVAKHGFQPVPTVMILLGLAVGFVFVRRQRVLAHPLLDMALFRNRAFSASLTTLLLTVMFLMGVQFVVAQFLQSVLGLSPMQAGLWMLPAVVGGMVAALAASGIVSKVRTAYVFGAGMVVAAVGFGLLTQVEAASGPGIVVTASILMFAGLAPVSALGIDMIVGAAPPDRAGPAAAISETANEFGGALGIAVVGSIVNAVYQSRMTGEVPASAPASAGDTLAGALQAAERLPGQAGDALAEAARSAFAHGLQMNALVATPLILLTATVVTVVLRNVRPAEQAEEDAAGPAEETKDVAPSSL